MKTAAGKAFGALVLLPLVLNAAAPEGGNGKPRDLNTPREFPEIGSRAQWDARAREIRQQVLVSCGLWPMPEKAAVNAKVFGRIEREGYSVEKVYLETYHGFFLAGNLYRPLGKGKGPFPGILNPHGHWAEGRLVDKSDGSVPARCINFARQGMIAFSYDMVGYNDTYFADYVSNHGSTERRHRHFATDQTNLLWNISLMGLQTWNSIRALDFIGSLPDVDRKRLACTGASGGGTQTFMLGAADYRLALQGPMVMVSHIMQGGCLCENAPNLRVDYSNMEIAASVAPRPQILVAATGDWTKTTLTIEGPAIAKIYELLKARDHFKYVRYDFDHNYNRTTREAVYGWFDKWLLNMGNGEPIPELPYHKEADADLRVFPDNQLPAGAITEAQLIAYLQKDAERRWRDLLPNGKGGIKPYRETMLPAWRHTLLVDWPGTGGTRAAGTGMPLETTSSAAGQTEYRIPVGVEKMPLEVSVIHPTRSKSANAVIIAESGSTQSTTAGDLQREFLQRGLTVLRVKTFSTPESQYGDQYANFYCVYNRTKAQARTRDLVTACAFARDTLKARNVALCGVGAAGAWALLAAPAANGVVADCSAIDTSSDQALLATDLYCAGLRNIGGFEGTLLLAAPNAVTLFNVGEKFALEHLQSCYHHMDSKARLRIYNSAPDVSQTARLIVEK